MKKKMIYLTNILIFLVTAGMAQATLTDLGNDLIFDDVQNITWYDFPFNPSAEDWPVTENWVNNLTYMEWTDWRLPTNEELQSLGNEFRETGAYSTGPFEAVGSGLEFYLSSTVTGNDQRWAYSLRQDRSFATWPVASIYGVAVRDGDTVVPVPEPAGIILIGLGFSGLVVATFMRKNERSSSG